MKNSTSSLVFSMALLLPLALVGCGPMDAGDEFDDEAAEAPATALGEAVESEGAAEAGDADLVAWCNDVTTWDPAWTDFEDQVLTLVNQKRAAGATCGGVAYPKAPALTFDERLRCAARKHSKDMGVKNYMDHTGSDGSTPWARMKSAGYTYTQAAENIAAGYSTPTAVVNAWMTSSGHCKNIMNATLKNLGVGYYKVTTGYKYYWTQDFGKP